MYTHRLSVGMTVLVRAPGLHKSVFPSQLRRVADIRGSEIWVRSGQSTERYSAADLVELHLPGRDDPLGGHVA